MSEAKRASDEKLRARIAKKIRVYSGGKALEVATLDDLRTKYATNHWLWTGARSGVGVAFVKVDGKATPVAPLLARLLYGEEAQGRLESRCGLVGECVCTDHRLDAGAEAPLPQFHRVKTVTEMLEESGRGDLKDYVVVDPSRLTSDTDGKGRGLLATREFRCHFCGGSVVQEKVRVTRVDLENGAVSAHGIVTDVCYVFDPTDEAPVFCPACDQGEAAVICALGEPRPPVIA